MTRRRRQLALGMRVEREHDDVTGGDPRLVRRIVLAHLRERPDYYDRLARCVENPRLYHRTSEEAARAIVRSRSWISKEAGGPVYFSDRKHGHASGYGRAVLSVFIPKRFVEVDDSFPDGEWHYRVSAAALRGRKVTVERAASRRTRKNPARSEAQRRLFGAALACKRRRRRRCFPAARRLARLPVRTLRAFARRARR